MSERPASFDAALMAALPSVRRLCMNLTRHRDNAEDLASDVICRALSSWHLFEPGSNMAAWLCTITRNHFLTLARKGGRMVEDVDGAHAAAVAIGGNQDHKLACDEAFSLIRRMPQRQRHAVICIALGDSYEDVAAETGLPIGTVKSELHRARQILKEIVA